MRWINIDVMHPNQTLEMILVYVAQFYYFRRRSSPLGGLTFTWKDENGTLVNQSPSASTFSAENSGLYTLEVWKDGCNRSDDVNVTATINTPDLGGRL